MADFIDREAVLTKIDQYTRHHWPTVSCVESIIKEQPAADVEPVRRWIPCSERLPEGVNRCLVCRYDYVTKTRFVDILWLEHGSWWNRLHGGNYAVTHWMPLPEPPEMEGGGKDG